ncbi:hypothetical protein K439DRAFT_1612882 [Ramaria rubella]|nr:hypothetical protein K439DRAFT_1612882 [Ramaria rubella]
MPLHPLLVAHRHPPTLPLAVKPDGHARWRWHQHRSVPAARGSPWVQTGLPAAFVVRNWYRGGWGGKEHSMAVEERVGVTEAATRAERTTSRWPACIRNLVQCSTLGLVETDAPCCVRSASACGLQQCCRLSAPG